MRILILGAGATGGYFGAAMQMAGIDVTFLVRPKRAETLNKNQLILESEILGSQKISVKTILGASSKAEAWDLILLTCKAYDLPSAIETIRPFVGQKTLILPLLNGLKHLDILTETFGASHILGGTCKIFADLSSEGIIQQNGKIAEITFGLMKSQDLIDEPVQMAERLAKVLEPVTGFNWKRADPIERALWDKWSLLAPLAAMTSLLRGNIGEIVATKDGENLVRQAIQEVADIAAKNQYPIAPGLQNTIIDILTKKDSPFAASMYKDILKGKKIEADHIIGDLLARAKGCKSPLLETAFCHLQIYQNRLT